MRPDLTSAEIAKSGSYFDDVLRDPRRYGIENTTGKVRRRGAVRRRRDAVCSERIVGRLGEGSARIPCAVLIPSLDGKRANHRSRSSNCPLLGDDESGTREHFRV
jgi:hypothetical protein